jgi:hypothetical protein
MRYSYGIMDRRKILMYKPQLFLKADDILVFPSKDFNKWYGDIKEYIDGLYQINSGDRAKDQSIDIAELNLAVGVLNSITEEMEHLFDINKAFDLSYQYVSTLDEKYKKRRQNTYSSDERRCEIKIPVKPEITTWLKHQHTMEIVAEAWKLFNDAHNKNLKKQKIVILDQ